MKLINHKNNKSILLILLIFLCTTAFGQEKFPNYSLIKGERIKYEGHKTSKIIGSDGLRLFMQRKDMFKDIVIFECFDKNMQLIKSQTIEGFPGDVARRIEFSVYFNDQILVFTSHYNEELKKGRIFLETLNKETLLPNNDLKEIGEIKTYTLLKKDNLNYRISKNKKFLMVYNHPYELSKIKNPIVLYTFNKDLETTQNYLSAEKPFQVKCAKVDDHGSSFFLLNTSDTIKSTGDAVIMSVDTSGQEHSYTISPKAKYLNNLRLAIGNNNDLICAGFYSTNDPKEMEGPYVTSFDIDTKKQIGEAYEAFSIEFIAQNEKKGYKRKLMKKAEKGKKKEVTSYKLDDIKLRKNGEVLLIGEYYYSTKVTYRIDGEGRVRPFNSRFHNYREIFIINLSPEGSILWARKIPKNQDAIGIHDRASYTKLFVNDNLFFFYNDLKGNLKKLERNRMCSTNDNKRNSLAMAVVDAQGQLSIKELFNNKKFSVVTIPKVSKPISDNQIILSGEYWKYKRLASVTIPE
ncbi:hypothetical protein RCC89_05070 [Cytophagaceae bacterium ABcell3]|nr:hypothetical protein RCC89_05070 [Cytophagaceae bacterium ABcell3]